MENQHSAEDDEEFLLEHYESDTYRGRLESPTVSFQMLNRTCGDSVTLDLELNDDRIKQAIFEAQGCVISQAAASILCESITGMKFDSLRSFDSTQMLKAIRITLSPRRKKCGLLAWEALQILITTFDSQVKGNHHP